jgi:CubicO group peptidase (beta-lactamase class C family)
LIASPYDENGQLTNMVYFTEQAAGLLTTSSDLAKFLSLILTNFDEDKTQSSLLSASLIKAMTNPVPNTDGRWSMSFVIDSDNNSLGFAGYNRGWVSLIRAVNDQKIGYVILTNSSIGEVSNEIDSLILGRIKTK